MLVLFLAITSAIEQADILLMPDCIHQLLSDISPATDVAIVIVFCNNILGQIVLLHDALRRNLVWPLQLALDFGDVFLSYDTMTEELFLGCNLARVCR